MTVMIKIMLLVLWDRLAALYRALARVFFSPGPPSTPIRQLLWSPFYR